MAKTTRNLSGLELDDYVEAYETAQGGDEQPDLAAFLPDPGDPLYQAVLRELVRIDLEYCWQRGHARRLHDYQLRFPALERDPEGLREIAFEENRLRQQMGANSSRVQQQTLSGVRTESKSVAPTGPLSQFLAAQADRIQAKLDKLKKPPSLQASAQGVLTEAALSYRTFHQSQTGDDPAALDSWVSSFQGSALHAHLFRDVHRSDPEAAYRLAEAVTSLPEVGTEFLGFRLMAELGQGAFARVYLAEQADLANRYVAVKVSTDLMGEPQRLAQLQHTNIVPVYSVHRASPLQAVCMPYFGSTTLADLLRDIERCESLPTSGKALVSTVHARRSTTQRETARGFSRHDHADAGPTSPPRPEEAVSTVAPTADHVNLKKLEGLTYVEAVLGMALRLAEGLAHAHERGILHRDLKPANILLTDDGQPMLLDFNLSQDTKLRGSTAAVGGTLPYMAPEHLDAFRGGTSTVDARSDVYSLGIILYELLTGHHPFPDHPGSLESVLPQLIADRLHRPPALRRWNPVLTPAVESMVRHCLEPEPAERYQSAQQLQEDLERHLRHLSLKHAPEPSLFERAHKFSRRHPRLTSSSCVAALAAAVLLALATLFVIRGQRLARLEAIDSLDQFQHDMRLAQSLLNSVTPDREHWETGMTRCRHALARYQVLDNPAWQDLPAVRALDAPEQKHLREGVGELLLLLARAATLTAADPARDSKEQAPIQLALSFNERAQGCFPGDGIPQALWSQRAELNRSLGQEAEAKRLLALAGATPLRTARDHYLAAADHAALGRFRQAVPLLQEATRLDPQNFWAWYVFGICQDGLAHDAEAAACFSTCIALSPKSHWSHFNRGLVYLRQRDYRQACADFDQTIRLQPDLADAYINRALTRQGLKKWTEAIQDFTRALELGTGHTRVYFMRAQAHEQAGDTVEAERDRALGMRLRPTDEKSWIARGVARLAREPEGALADFEQALACNPRSRAALQNKAHVLAEKLGRTQEAAAVLETVVALYPDSVPAWAERGVLRARLGQRQAAHKDAEEALLRDSKPATLYQVAGIYSRTSTQEAEDRREAFQLLSSALRKGYGFNLLESDPELDPIRNHPEFQRLVEAAQTLHPPVAQDTHQR